MSGVSQRVRSLTLPYAFLVVMAVLSAFPLVWIIISSVKPASELASDPLSFFPSEVTFAHYGKVLFELGALRNLGNSVIIALATTVLTIAASTTGAYGIVRFFPRVGQKLTQLLISTYMFPPILLAVPYSVIMVSVGLANTYVGLVLVYLSFSIPYAIWMLTAFYQTVPLEIEEAAQVDGAGKFRIFLTVASPIVLPGIVATAIYTFINSFNEFLYALLFINSSDKMPISVALYSLSGSEVLDWGAMMAACVVIVVPSVVFFLLIQRHIAAGLSEGSVK
ncbi:carbohydrate ABC transporter permease [Paramicrobacterium chengjingii]|uniref:Carbohydrate ABC transporter permease n=1 Tax=Paramicrobacterium chengjingii TaxID=2769067 RepID=A0ABX6YI63_9MICO|nr:carbohydrate ABC transporter permease [Microbacterium chengjingii]QPZ38451.1 carbohydrate ABC transporter permease [Microbacterium chengjingii]